MWRYRKLAFVPILQHSLAFWLHWGGVDGGSKGVVDVQPFVSKLRAKGMTWRTTGWTVTKMALAIMLSLTPLWMLMMKTVKPIHLRERTTPAGILPLPPSVWEATTRAALKRALEPHAPPQLSRARLADTMLNRFKSRHGLSGSVMHDLDDILTFRTENPDETFTTARQRRENMTEDLQLAAPDVTYEVGVMGCSVLSALLMTVYSLRVALGDASGQYTGSK
jgi:hypothetical protein